MSEAIILLLCDNCRTVTGNDARAEMPAQCFACGDNAWRVLHACAVTQASGARTYTPVEVLAGPVQS